MGKRKVTRPGGAYRGFRFGIIPKIKLNLKGLEKCEVLTVSQHEQVKEKLDACSKVDEDGKVKYTVDTRHIARLEALLDKPFNEAKVDIKGNPWSKPEPLEARELEELAKKEPEAGTNEVVVEDKKILAKLKENNKEK
jgi:hypothetical protein